MLALRIFRSDATGLLSDGWRPSITRFNLNDCVASQPLGHGERKSPGGFAPLGRTSRLSILIADLDGRGNVSEEPATVLRERGCVLLVPPSGSNAGQTTYPADIVNTQLIVEDILDDKRDVGFRNGVFRCSQSVHQMFTKRPELVGLVGNRLDVTKRESALGAAILL